MAYPGVFSSEDGRILRAMQGGAANGGLIMMHAENGIAIGGRGRPYLPPPLDRDRRCHPSPDVRPLPPQGTIAPGADADIVTYDPHAEQVISAGTHHMNVDYSGYEGRRITGRVETVLSRGGPVTDGRTFAGRAGHDRYTPHGTCQYLV